jgi:hypothetical protein
MKSPITVLIFTTGISELAYTLCWYAVWLKNIIGIYDVFEIILSNMLVKFLASIPFAWLTNITVRTLEKLKLTIQKVPLVRLEGED